MSFLYLAGEASNHILTATMSSASEDSNLPWSNLNNPQGWFAGRFNVAAADDYVHADLGSSKAATFCGVFFQNLDAGITVELRRGASGTTLVSTMTKSSPGFYSTFSATDQDWRLKFVGTNTQKIYIGKWVLGVHKTLAATLREPYKPTEIMEQLQVDKSLPPKNLTTFPGLSIPLNFFAKTIAERDEVLDMRRDSKFGAEPLVVVPDTNDASVVLYGRAADQWTWSQKGLVYQIKARITDDSFPVIVN